MNPKKAFTLIELLVVIAIIGLLLAVIVPSMQAAKQLASGAVCLNNQKQLSLAWTAYHSDYKSYLVGGSNYFRGPSDPSRPNPTPYRWVEAPLLRDTDNPENTLTANLNATPTQYSITTRKNGIRAGKLYPYAQKEDLFHCPGDKNFTKNEPDAVYRSYAIAGLMNGEHFNNRDTSVSGIAYMYTPITGYRSAYVSQTASVQSVLKVAVKFNEVASPGTKYVFVEEDVTQKGQKVNAGGFVLLDGGNYHWWDWPAYYHNDSSTLGFADGHAERHRWSDPRTLQIMKFGDNQATGGISKAAASLNNKDLDWMVHGYLPIPPR